jgi:hypothetical protein
MNAWTNFFQKFFYGLGWRILYRGFISEHLRWMLLGGEKGTPPERRGEICFRGLPHSALFFSAIAIDLFIDIFPR